MQRTKSIKKETKVYPKALPRPKSLGDDIAIPEEVDKNSPLELGIHFHENNQFEFSAYYFSIAASQGDSTGSFLYAISLRHGWGTEKDEKLAFQMLSAITDSLCEDKVTGTYIPLALYEVAMSFQNGWGTKKDKAQAAYYFKLAAQLGDAEAQVALGECFLRGDGIKPNKKMAATWFRKAEKQGARLVQMQWIWKEKYNETLK
jgi:TPR repeat protein